MYSIAISLWLWVLAVQLVSEPSKVLGLLFPSSSRAIFRRDVSVHQQRSMHLFSFSDQELDLLDYLRNEMIHVTELSKDVYGTDRDFFTERFAHNEDSN